MSVFKDTGGNGIGTILLTTPVLLLNHVEPTYPWDCIIRTDFPDNCLMSWTKRSNGDTDNVLSHFVHDFAFEKSLSEIHDIHTNDDGEYQALLTDQRTVEREKRLVGYEHIPVFPDSTTMFHCHGCGLFLCNEANVRKLDELWLVLDESVPYRSKFISHPQPIVFGRGCGKLARFVCKECGQKWGIVAYLFCKSYLALAKDGIDVYIDGQLQKYQSQWSRTNLAIIPFHYENDAWRCLPLTLRVNGQSLSLLLESLPDNRQILPPEDRHKTSCIGNRHTSGRRGRFKIGYNVRQKYPKQ